MALVVALVTRPLGFTSGFATAAIHMGTPAEAVLTMLIITGNGFSREGWKSLGLHRVGLKGWSVALLLPLGVGVVATAVVWAAPLASFVVPEAGGDLELKVALA